MPLMYALTTTGMHGAGRPYQLERICLLALVVQ